jgi:oxalate decarboxylase/phosphoglucose isomerase-like protein (cupin superfamily)
LAEAGTCMIVPPDAVHAFGNPTGEPATLLVISTPNPGREHYFEQLAEELRNQAGPRREVIEKLASEFDQYPAPGS